MKPLGLVRAGSRRERSAMSKSEARKFINQLIAHPRIRQKASELRPHEDISEYVIDHDLSPCQVVLSVKADSPLSLQHKLRQEIITLRLQPEPAMRLWPWKAWSLKPRDSRTLAITKKAGLFYLLPAFFRHRPYTGASVMVGYWDRKASSALLAS